MKKIIYVLIIFLFSTQHINSQSYTTYRFNYYGSGDANCAPNLNDGWLSSHGSPCYGDVYGQNIYNVLKLEGGIDENWNKKTEGVFKNISLSRLYKYDISISVSHDKGRTVGMEMFAATGLTENKKTDCSEDDAPYITNKSLIHKEHFIYDGLLGHFSEILVSNWIPDNNYSQLWIKSLENGVRGDSGTFFIQEIRIYNKGKVDEQAPTTPTNLKANNIGSNYLTVSWNASTDNTGVKGYQIYLNGYYLTTTNSTQITMPNLASCTNYTIGVKAFDNYENTSSLTTINLQTKSSISENVTIQNTIDLSTHTEDLYIVKALNSINIQNGFSVYAINNKSFETQIVEGCNNVKTIKSDIDIPKAMLNNESWDDNLFSIDGISIAPNINKPTVTYRTIQMDKVNPKNISVFPNPTTGLIYIELSNLEEIKHIEILNNLGEKILENKILDNTTEIDISNQLAGIYYLKIILDNEVITKKIIKN